MLTGELEFWLQGQPFTLGAGDFCRVEQGKRFRYANRSASPARIVLGHTPSFDLASEVFEPRRDDSR